MAPYEKALEKHGSAALHFSGGKDSLCLLHLLKPHWDDIVVTWVNTGVAFPETIEQMEQIRRLVPHFLEVKSNQPAQNDLHGPPADLVSVWDTTFGRGIHENRPFKVQPVVNCCGENIWAPMYQAMKERGFTLVFRGQRNEELRKGFIRSGHVEDGVEYIFPLEDWTEAQVRSFLKQNDVPLPRHYEWFNTSGDCMTCTGYLDENYGKLEYLQRFHPITADIVVKRLQYIRSAAREELKHIDKVLENA